MNRIVLAALALTVAIPGLAQEVSILDLNTTGVISKPFVYLDPDQPSLDGRFFFRADSDDGDELWVTDGTAGGTSVEDLVTGAGSSIPDVFTAVGNRIFFSAINPGLGRELWTTTGPNQASLVADLEAGEGDSTPRALTALDDTLFFTAEVAGSRGLYTVDSLTMVVTEVAWGVVEADFYTEMVEDNSRVYFKGTAASGGDVEIWTSNGTTAGTEQATNLGCPEWGELLGAGTSVFVVCDFGTSTELFRLDPSPATGVSLVHRFGDRVVDQLTPAGGTLYMNVGNDEIWGYDNGTGSVDQVTNFGGNAAPGNLIRYQSGLMFSASSSAGRELYWTDGAAVTEIDIRTGSASSDPIAFRLHDGHVYFTAEDAATDRELWRTDGTPAGTVLIADIDPSGDSQPVPFAEVNGGLVFNAASAGDHLYFTDGTPGSATLLLSGDVPTSGNPHTMWNGHLYFAAGDQAGTRDLWRTDGTLSGTENLQLEPLGTASKPSFLAAGPDRLYLSAYDLVAKREIHILEYPLFSDGFETGDTSAW